MTMNPAGTYLCQLFWFTPGTFVFSCEVQPCSTNAGSDGLVYITIKQSRSLNALNWTPEFRTFLQQWLILSIYSFASWSVWFLCSVTSPKARPICILFCQVFDLSDQCFIKTESELFGNRDL